MLPKGDDGMPPLTSFGRVCRPGCDVPPSIQAERHPTRQPAGAAGAGEQTDHAGQQPRGPAAAEEAAVSAVTTVTAISAVTTVSGAAVTGVTSLWEACGDHGAD